MRAWIAFLIVALIWGSYYFAVALAIESFTPFGLVALRYLSGGILALLLSRAFREEFPHKQDLPHLMLQGFLLLTAASALVAWGQSRVSSGTAAVLCSTTPLFYAVLGRENLGLRAWSGLILGLGGVAILIFPNSGAQVLDLWGVLAILLAVFLWAYGTLHGRSHVKGQGLLGQVGVQMLTGGVMGLLIVPFTGGFLHTPLTWQSGLSVAYLVILIDLVGFSAFVYLSKVWPPTKMSTYVYINPLVAVLLGSLILGEPFSVWMALGMAVIFVGVALLQIPRCSSAPEPVR